MKEETYPHTLPQPRAFIIAQPITLPISTFQTLIWPDTPPFFFFSIRFMSNLETQRHVWPKLSERFVDLAHGLSIALFPSPAVWIHDDCLAK
jgi:hypothetical protein